MIYTRHIHFIVPCDFWIVDFNTLLVLFKKELLNVVYSGTDHIVLTHLPSPSSFSVSPTPATPRHYIFLTPNKILE